MFGNKPGQRVIELDETDSTNSYAARLLHDQVPEEGTVIFTGGQTAGKGQRGSTWESEPFKNLLISYILYPGFLNIQDQFLLNQAIAIAILETLQSLTTAKIVVKWPNDILINGKKVAGILLDAEVQGNSLCQIIIGIGVNSNNDLDLTKLMINDKNDYDITTIKYENQNIEISNHDFIQYFLKSIDDVFQDLKSSEFVEELATFYKHKIMESQKHLKYRFSVGGNKFNGEIRKIYHDGSLLVKNLESNQDNNLVRINSVYDLSQP